MAPDLYLCPCCRTPVSPDRRARPQEHHDIVRTLASVVGQLCVDAPAVIDREARDALRRLERIDEVRT